MQDEFASTEHVHSIAAIICADASHSIVPLSSASVFLNVVTGLLGSIG
jgi:hypothetical protein